MRNFQEIADTMRDVTNHIIEVVTSLQESQVSIYFQCLMVNRPKYCTK